MKKYEIVIILDDRKVQDEGRMFAEEFRGAVAKNGGKVRDHYYLGRKQFAREIKKRKTGYYWDFIAELDEKDAKEMPDRYRLEDRVLRMQVYIHDREEELKPHFYKEKFADPDAPPPAAEEDTRQEQPETAAARS